MKKVIFLTKYGRAGASSRYRFYNYQKYFKDFNFEFKPLLDDDYINLLYNSDNKKKIFLLKIISIIKRFFYLIFSSSKNLYIIEKELFPNAPYFIEKILLCNKKYALDYDDFVGASYKNIFLLKNKLHFLVENSIFTTVGNRWYFEEFNFYKNLIYLPTVIDIDKYEINYTKKISKINNLDSINIVWIGSPSTSKYLNIIEKPFKKISKKYNVNLIVIGGVCPFDNDNVITIRWEEISEIDSISKGDIGIMPLYDTLWEKGKCGFKLIQYMGVGLPVVGSPSPANDEIIYKCGYICKTENDWFNALEKLILDDCLRKKLGYESFSKIKNDYSYQKWGDIYNSIIKKYL